MPKSKKENIEEITLDPIEEKVKEPAPVEEPEENIEEPETVEEDAGEEITEPVEGEPEDVEFDEEAGDEETDEDAPEEDAPPFLGLMLGAKNVPVSEDPDPQSRIEALLWHIINNTTTDEEPQSRNEAILTAIANSGTYTAEAQSRIEALLIAILNHEEVDITPISRNEAILKAIANSGEYDEEAQSRNEELLLKWLEAWEIVIETATGAIANFNTSLVLPLIDVKAEIKAVETGTGAKSPSNPYVISGFTGVNLSHSDADTSNPTVYPVSWQTEAGEVFGGYYDFTTGKLVVTHGRVDLGLLNWSLSSVSNKTFYGIVSDVVKTNGSSICSIYTSGDYTAWSTQDYIINLNFNNNLSLVRISDSRFVGYTREQIQNALSGVYAYCELATPVEYDLTPQQISPLLGVNNIWSDTNGDTTVKYKKKRNN